MLTLNIKPLGNCIISRSIQIKKAGSLIQVGSWSNNNASGTVIVTLDKTVCTWYASLTAADIIYQVTQGRWWADSGNSSRSDVTWNVSKSYNASTGVLTLSGMYSTEGGNGGGAMKAGTVWVINQA